MRQKRVLSHRKQDWGNDLCQAWCNFNKVKFQQFYVRPDIKFWLSNMSSKSCRRNIRSFSSERMSSKLEPQYFLLTFSTFRVYSIMPLGWWWKFPFTNIYQRNNILKSSHMVNNWQIYDVITMRHRTSFIKRWKTFEGEHSCKSWTSKRQYP